MICLLLPRSSVHSSFHDNLNERHFFEPVKVLAASIPLSVAGTAWIVKPSDEELKPWGIAVYLTKHQIITKNGLDLK